MSSALIVWVVLLSVVGLVWLTRHAEISRARRTERVLSSRAHPGPLADPPRISVLVAAKDEEANIAACVQSLLDQDYPDYELIVIDDRSTDRTGEVLQQFQEAHPQRMRALTVTQLRDGWFGKNNAMREGIAASTGQWLCFADADCTQTSRRTLTVAMQECLAEKTDFLSILPVLITRSFWERIIQPVCAAIMMIWFRPEKVNNPASSAAYANGAFMLMTRQAYDSIGGHDAVKSEVNEDIHMARLAKQQGLRLQVIQNDDLYTTHMYASLGAAWRGWSRIFYGCLGTFRRLIAALVVLTTFSLFPWISLVVTALGYFLGADQSSGSWGWMVLGSGLVVALEQSVIARFYGIVRMPVAYSLGYPLGAAITWGMLVAATLKLGGTTTTTWRGTTYRAHTLESTDAASSSGT
ncbi:MAG: glycosyltransferase [bacterium]|nr:glycosyltransferase [bacterium]